jgi:hypothetical protein
MSWPHNPKGKKTDLTLFHVGNVPVSAGGISLQNTFNFARNYKQNMVAAYIGRPDRSINGSTTGATLRKFHVITGSPVKADWATNPKRQLCVAVKLWHYNWGSGTRTWKWYETMGGGSSTLLTEDLIASGANDTDVDYPSGEFVMFPQSDGDCQYTPVVAGTDDGFVASTLEVDYALVSALGVWEMPTPGTWMTDTQVYNTPSPNFHEEQTLRGVDGASISTSVGALADNINQAAKDTMVHNTRRCLFQTCYPICAYSDGVGSGVQTWNNLREDSAGNAQTYRVIPSNLTEGSSDIDCYPAIVLGAGTADGVEIRVSSVTAGDKWEYVQSGAVGSDTLITASDGTGATGTGVMVDPDEDFIKIEVKASTSVEALIKTVSLWEPSSV